jgi:predicted nucleic acid-binding protein
MARQAHLTEYDAAYLELALRLQLPLATLDARLMQAAKTVGVPWFEL